MGKAYKLMDLKDKYVDCLRQVEIEGVDGTLVDLKLVKGISEEGESIQLDLELPSHSWPAQEELEKRVRNACEGVGEGRPLNFNWITNVRPMATRSGPLLPEVAHVILCASGKGGVGKSTVAANLATALHQDGANVGLLDADIYGPSIPVMFSLREKPTTVDEKTIEPLTFRGMKLMSIGYLLEPHEALVWRGPMIANALMQLVRDVRWGKLDYLIIDLPPGTGDVQLTISQQLEVSGAVVVSTPQEVALADVYRAKQMFDRVRIDMLGLVENMSYFICDGCDKKHAIFDNGGARRAAEKLDLSFLAEIPLDGVCRAGGDAGIPVVWSHPDAASSKAFRLLAQRVARKIAMKTLKAWGHDTVAKALETVAESDSGDSAS